MHSSVTVTPDKQPESRDIETKTEFLYRPKFINDEKRTLKIQENKFVTNDPALEEFIESTKILIDKQLKQQHQKKSNLSKNERKALKILKKPEITTKPADKVLEL